MKSWNLRTLVFMRSLCMLILPLWFLIYRSGLPMAFVWYLVFGAALVIKSELEKVKLKWTSVHKSCLTD